MVRETSTVVDPGTGTTGKTTGVSDGTGEIVDSEIIVTDGKSLVDGDGSINVSADSISTDVVDTPVEIAASTDATGGVVVEDLAPIETGTTE